MTANNPVDLFDTARKVVRLTESYSDELACEIDTEILRAAYELEALRARVEATWQP